jgi:pimeloyl-ACP methyl ester carboxylesterase/ribosomal protein S18 acetylase RimI-like enzyme
MTTDNPQRAAREHRLALSDGRTICYGLYGAADGALVVVLDGPGSRGLGRAMAAPAERLGVTLLVPDRPDFGGSTQSSNGSYAATADDLLAVVERAGFERFGIVAQSGGTPYGLALASAAGDRATGLSFVGALAPLRDRDALSDVARPMRNVFVLARRAPWLLRPLFGVLARLTRGDPDAAARRYAEQLPSADRAVLEDSVNWAIHATSSAEILSHPRAVAREVRMLAQPWEIDYGRVTAPVAFWAGELDVTHPPSMSRQLARRLDGAPVTVVAGAGTFALSARYPDALRHAAALPGEGSVDLAGHRTAAASVRIRDAKDGDASVLEGLQRRSSDVWAQYREQLAAHPEAIELPQAFIDNGWVRVAAGDDDTPIGFSVVIPSGTVTGELDGLFVEPDHMRRGIGRALVEDAVARTAACGGARLEVTAGPAQGFYERTGFQVIGDAQTRFGPAVRMRRTIGG